MGKGRRNAALGMAAGWVVAWLAWAPASAYGPPVDGAPLGGNLTIGSLVEPPALDPFHQAADARIAVSLLMYQGLMYEDPSGAAQPLLATGYEVSDDGLTYIFTVREGVTFHTGAAMTAADVKYSYDYIRNPDNGSPGARDFNAIDAIETPDATTVVFRLNRPNAALPMTLTNKYGAVVPAGYFDDDAARNRMNVESVGTGPFKLVSFQPNSLLGLARFEDYWEDGAPYLDEVTFLFMPNAASLLVALRNQRIDLAVLGRPQDSEQLAGVPGLEITRFPSLNHKTLDLDANHPVLSDVRVRQAISLAIDKDELMRAAIGDYGTTIGTIVAGMQDAWGLPLDQVPFQGPDIAAAKALLAEAGYADGVDLELATIIGYDWMDPAGATLAQQLSEVGITLGINKVELGVWISNFRSRQMGFTFNDWGTSPDPHLLFYRHYHKQPSGADFRNWNNDDASALLAQGQATADFAERQRIYKAFQEIFATSVPTVMLFSPDWVVVTTERVKNYVQHPTGWYFGLIRAYVE